MQGPQFWIIMAVFALLAWLGVRMFVQTMAEGVTGEAPAPTLSAPA